MTSTSSEPRRLAALPGYDTAPDIYETPDLTDDTATTVRSPSSDRGLSGASETSEEDDGDDDDGASYGVSRRRLYPERARHRFGATSARVETRGVDLSDRVDGRRRGYGVRRRVGGREDADEESLEQRIARLKREVEECKAQAEREQGASEEGEAAHKNGRGDLDSLSRLLASVEAPAAHASRNKTAAPPPDDARDSHDAEGEDDIPAEQLLSRVTAFDSRLAALEQVLGASSLDSARPDAPLATPLLPTLGLLDQQLGALQAATSLGSLEAASARLATLRRDAHDLATANTHADADASPLTADDLASLRALAALLPSLQALGATVPSVVARLRSLRTLHTTAAGAAQALDAVERRQAALDRELQAWRQGLAGVEAAVAGASEANGKNGRFVQGWVQELEARIQALGR
nr:isoform 3 of dynactin subunit 2 [Quercus suber]